MSDDPTNRHNLAFSSRCLPGSLAEQQEAERLAEFHRRKAIREAEAERNRPQEVAERHQIYLDACEANRARARSKFTRIPRKEGP